MTKRTFDLDAAIADATGEAFPFTWGGQAYELPSFSSIPADELIGALDGTPAEQLAVIRRHLGDIGDRVFALPLGAVNALFEAWMRHSGLGPGEAAAS